MVSLSNELAEGDEFDLELERTEHGEVEEVELEVANVTERGRATMVTFHDSTLRWWEIRGRVFVTNRDNELIDPDKFMFGKIVTEELEE